MPSLSWSESTELESSDLLQMVNNGTLDYTCSTQTSFASLKAYFPNLDIAFKTKTTYQMAWPSLTAATTACIWPLSGFAAAKHSNLLATLSERFTVI